MKIPNNNLFCIYGVGAIIERRINGKYYILIQNRIRRGDESQDHLIEVPCGKVRATENSFDVIQRRVLEETGLKIRNIAGWEGNSLIENNILNCKPFYACQNINGGFPVAINFFVCSADGSPKLQTEAADNIRWIAIDELSNMLENKREKFFSIVVGALKEYIKMKERNDDYGIYE